MTETARYTATTKGIRVSVEPRFLDEQSRPEIGRYVWAYTIDIENVGAQTLQLRERYWEITDDTGHTEIVQGPGVVGEQPVLAPGDRYRYTSGCPLSTPSGFMVGRYMMAAPADGEGGDETRVDVAIPAFALDMPLPDDHSAKGRLH